MRIRLTAQQVQQLMPYVDRVRATAAMGNLGMLVAQIGYDNNWHYWLTPAFLDHDLAKVITERGRALVEKP
jgi:hypothetical protein